MAEYPRGVEERLQWMVENEPGEVGQCARWTWLALGDGVNPPKWGCPDANSVVDKTRAAGDLYAGSDPPRGAIVLYTSSGYGHMCLSKGGGQIMTTDPPGNPGGTGTWDIDGPVNEWGQKYAGWSQRYNYVLIPMTEPGKVYVDLLVQGSSDSDSVRRLQDVLNHTSLPSPGDMFLPVLGNYGEDTQTVVQVWQTENGFPKGVITNEQADRLFAGTGHTVIHATEVQPEPPEPEPIPPEPEGISRGFGLWKWYSGKKDSSVTVQPGEWVPIDLPAQPASGISEDSTEFHFLYLRIKLPEGRSATRTIETKFTRSDGDETAYFSPAWDADARNSIAYYNIHMESGSGLGGKWYIKVSGGSDPITYTTRYAKSHVHYLDEGEAAAAMFGLPLGAVRFLAALLLFLAVLATVLGLAATT